MATVAITMLQLVTLAPIAAGQAPAAASAPLPFEKLFGGPFELIDYNGIVRTDKDFRGKFMLIYFGYTSCPSICPTNLQHMAEALDALGEDANKIQPLFITVDPERDTQDVVKDYVGYFGPSFVGLTGSEAQVRRVAKAYRVHRRKIIEDNSAPDDYLVDHASLTLLVGPQGGFKTLFAHNTSGAVMAARIVKYLGEQGS